MAEPEPQPQPQKRAYNRLKPAPKKNFLLNLQPGQEFEATTKELAGWRTLGCRYGIRLTAKRIGTGSDETFRVQLRPEPNIPTIIEQ
jgi:hypothetical protein